MDLLIGLVALIFGTIVTGQMVHARTGTRWAAAFGVFISYVVLFAAACILAIIAMEPTVRAALEAARP